jgi:hypothetical protein
MHPIVIRLRSLLCSTLLVALPGLALRAQQTQVDAIRMVVTPEQQAQILLIQGKHDSATTLLGNHLTTHPTDGRSWMYLGRIYLADIQRWHRDGHAGAVAPSALLDFAGSSFERSQELLTDSGSVYRVIVALERATLRAEEQGWDSVRSIAFLPEELPLPPVLAELGRNLLASCPQNGVMLTGTMAETAAVWGTLLGGDRPDMILVRPDMYRHDGRYRARMASKLGIDSAADLVDAVGAVARVRPVCLGPTVDSIVSPGLRWYAARLVLASVPPPAGPGSPLTLFHYARTGLAGSVWTAAARDVYDLAARRNHAMCATLFVGNDGLNPPPIAACTP